MTRSRRRRRPKMPPKHVCDICGEKQMQRMIAHSTMPLLPPGKTYTFCQACSQISVGLISELGPEARHIAHSRLADRTR